MKLTLKQEWRPRPLGSFLGFMDLKMGVTLGLIFALLNKVAGVYGLVAIFTGASFAQISLYIYSTLALIAFVWGLKAVSEEDPRRSLYFAHVFFADHVLSTAWTVFFAVVWWIYTPHDGRRVANSAAQEEMMKGGAGHNMTDEERTMEALTIWNKEKGTAAAVIIVGWCVKIYFAVLIYSYAIHLRKGSYRSLPHSSSFPSSTPHSHLNAQYTSINQFPETVLGDVDEEEYDELSLYRMPSSSSTKDNIHTYSSSAKPPPSGSSITSFADFVSAPGRGRRFRNNNANGSGSGSGSVSGTPRSAFFPHAPSQLSKSASAKNNGVDEMDEVLFDSDEMGTGVSKSGTRTGTEESVSEDGDRDREVNGSAGGRRTPGIGQEGGRVYGKDR